jgi:putative Mn2+ efflux pump MntP
MGLFQIILIAIGLSMDAFAVAITLGLSVKKLKLKHVLITGLLFGIFQGIMPLIGYAVGQSFANVIQDLDHWVAFVLLGIIGGKMIVDSFSKDKENTNENAFILTTMLVLAIATSIDALAVGVTFAFFEINVVMAVLFIGFITFFISMWGVKIGNMFGTKFKSKAEFIGGVVLVVIGLKILIEHLFFQ